jgi:radical SAM superfamily enzyme YgiQ (UPF0313 family)
MKDILIFYPSSSPDIPAKEVDFERYKSVPIGILSIATYLKHNGYNVKIIDGRACSKKESFEAIKRRINNLSCLCVSATTVQLKHALRVCDAVKEIDKDLPILFGGIHPIMYPLQTIRDPSIDYVVYGEGEYAILHLMKYLEGKIKDISKIKGLVYKKNGKPVMNPMQPGIDPNELPLPDYTLLDIEKYIEREFVTNLGKIRKMRGLDIVTARGCPYRCTFCTNTMKVFCGWRPLKLEKVFYLIDHLVETHKLEHIWFADDMMFANKNRVLAIANHIIEKKHNITWEANARIDMFGKDKIDDKTMARLKQSGCYALRIGMESGSNRILKLMKKDATVQDTINSVEACEKHGIMPIGNFICGFPTETKKEVMETGKLILKLKEISPNGLFFSPGLLRPYPGTELYDVCLKYGYKEPETLREWANKEFQVGLFVEPHDLPWIKDPDWLLNFQVYFYILTVMKTHELTKKKLSPAWKLFGKIAEYRMNHNFWNFSIEPKLLINAKKFLDSDSAAAKTVKKVLSL